LRGRYAPSPTGDLHVGNARTALAAWLAARSSDGAFVMRVEDLDPPRVVAGAEERTLDDLRWLGLDWDEGPDVGGPHVPYRQSERTRLYRQALRTLEAAGRLYACTCSRAELRGLLSAPHGPGTEGPPYPGTCRDRGIPVEIDVDASARQRRPALRFRVNPGERVEFDDAVYGETKQDVSADVGDFIVRRSDGLFTYQLAATVDDVAMGISQVVRGADLLHSTPRQILLLRALKAAVPAYGHIPLVLNASGERLAKRTRPTAIRDVRDAGVSPERIVGAMAHTLGLLDRSESVKARDLIEKFRWKKIDREPWLLTRDAVMELGS
jgi:glutamyl-tRNA synthetase